MTNGFDHSRTPAKGALLQLEQLSPAAPGGTRVLLVSTYEMGHQPLNLAAPAAVLRAAGHAVETLDLAVEAPLPFRFGNADLVAISVPMHTAARLAVELARRVRRLNPNAHIACYGLYASPLHERLAPEVDSVIGGEYEPALLALADRLAEDGPTSTIAGLGSLPSFARQSYPRPDRAGLPALDRYARVDREDGLALAGYVEATHGCAHTCTHCPITPVYAGRMRAVPPETVLADIEQLIELGAQHITFGDPDFLNGVRHSLAIVREFHAEHADVTFDATIKVEHLIEHEPIVEELRDLGCLFITSAFESTNERILALLEKGHTVDDMEHVLAHARDLGVTIRPTWVAFTPWTRRSDFVEMLDFIERNGLVRHVQPVQYALRLLLPPGSPLNATLRAEGLLGTFDEERLTYTWANAEIDALQAELATIVEAAATAPADGDHEHGESELLQAPVEDPLDTFRAVKAATLGTALASTEVAEQPSTFVPGLTEAWFC